MTSSISPDIASLAPAVLNALRAAGVAALMRTLHPSLWAQTCAHIEYFPVDYSSAMIDYQLAYWSGKDHRLIDLSVIIEHDNRPCAVWPLSAIVGFWDGKINVRIGSNGGRVLPPLFVAGTARKSVKSLTRGCIQSLETLCRVFGQPVFESEEAYVGDGGLSVWHDQLMVAGGISSVRHDLFVDLSGSLTDIKAAFRKSYKALIASGEKLWDVQVVSSSDKLQWKEFHQLHIAVAGRVTRSDESWRLQYEAVSSGEAFFVRLRERSGRMVGAGLFYVTKDEGLYAVGAYDRSLFDRPLGHVVQHYAIAEMKRRGLRWYKLGIRAYPNDVPAPTMKERSISDFKQGFSSHLYPRHIIHYKIVS